MSKGLDIIVCIKQVPDPEAPPSAFSFDSQNLSISSSGVPPVISPFDENALELALRLKEKTGGSITPLSAGKGISRAVMVKASAAGADDALLIDDPALERTRVDGFATAMILAAAIRRRGPFDLILTGRQASDTNAGLVGIGIAHFLDIPCITLAGDARIAEGEVTVERVPASGHEVVKAAMPALLTVSHEVGNLRYPSLVSMRVSKNKPVTVMTLADLAIDPEAACRLTMQGLEVPVRERSVVMIDGKDSRAAGIKLALLLREDSIL